MLVMVCGADWPRFRGPDATGISPAKGLPDSWSPAENLRWKTALPGPGSSSPVLVGNRVILTAYSGYGVGEGEPGEITNLRLHTLAVDAATGKVLWDQVEKAQMPEQQYRGFVALHGYASPTAASDGEAIFVFFGRSGVFCYDLQGKKLWQAQVGEGTHQWGTGASPVLFQNLVIINASIESQSVVGLDKATGKEVWRAGGIRESWSTPLVLQLPNGKSELIVSTRGKAFGFDPATGKLLWECRAVDDYVCPAVVGQGEVAYITGGRKPHTLAIRAGGRGDVSSSHILWESKKSTKVPTPLLAGDRLYCVAERGATACLATADGKTIFEERLQVSGGGDKIYASPVLADGKIYIVTRQGETVVLAAGKEFSELGRNNLADQSIFNATPAIRDGQIFIRSDKFLYCVGKK